MHTRALVVAACIITVLLAHVGMCELYDFAGFATQLSPVGVCDGIAVLPAGASKKVSVEHPTGEFSVALQTDPANPQNVTQAALLRTARLLMRGEVMVPRAVWPR